MCIHFDNQLIGVPENMPWMLYTEYNNHGSNGIYLEVGGRKLLVYLDLELLMDYPDLDGVAVDEFMNAMVREAYISAKKSDGAEIDMTGIHKKLLVKFVEQWKEEGFRIEECE